MSTNAILGTFGGILIALAVFINFGGVSWADGETATSISMVQFVAGIAIAVFLLLKRVTWALYFTITATTIGLILLIDVLRQGFDAISLGFVVTIAGVVLALVAIIGDRPSRTEAPEVLPGD
ncbi:MAG: hypothetical protein CVT64_11345 [Actinobacteria bacterium HGW-Actinobacteria-4]|nr:MAG: hypothetical protein CVT64_11345 [Actinobacteria bacterium HGW-Actinobacteria-4]